MEASVLLLGVWSLKIIKINIRVHRKVQFQVSTANTHVTTHNS